MDILSIAILIFIIMELANVIILYFQPHSQLGNGVGYLTPFTTRTIKNNSCLFPI